MKKAITTTTTMTMIAFSLMITGCNEKGKGINEEQEQVVDYSKEKSDSRFSINKDEVKKEENPITSIINPSQKSESNSSTSKGVVRVVKTTTSQIALKQYEEKDFFGTIVATVEGYRPNFYKDNINPAIGFGWNFAPTTKATNRRLATGAGLDKGLTEQLLAVSPSARLSPDEAMRAAHEFNKQLIEKPAINFFGASNWNKLSDNQKAVLEYHFYKTGTAGGSKYVGLKKAVEKYASNKTQANSDEVVSHITYNYKIKVADGWKQMTDKRSQLCMGTLWNSPEAYANLIGKGKFQPATLSQFNQVAKIAKVSVNPSSTTPIADQVDSQDELVQMKEQAAHNGLDLQVEQVIDGKTVPYSVEPIKTEEPKPKQKPQPQTQAQAPAINTEPPKAEPVDPTVPAGCKKMMNGNTPYLSCSAEALARMNK